MFKKQDIWSLLNKKHTVIRDADYVSEDFSEPEDEALAEIYQEIQEKSFETIQSILSGGRLEALYLDEEIHIYVDGEGMLKDNLEQNESLAYLMAGLVPGWCGLLYGAAAIECKSEESKKKMNRWINRLDEGYVEAVEISDQQWVEMWNFEVGEYQQKYPLK